MHVPPKPLFVVFFFLGGRAGQFDRYPNVVAKAILGDLLTCGKQDENGTKTRLYTLTFGKVGARPAPECRNPRPGIL